MYIIGNQTRKKIQRIAGTVAELKVIYISSVV